MTLLVLVLVRYNTQEELYLQGRKEGKEGKKEDARVIRFISRAFFSSFFNQLSPIHNLTRFPLPIPNLPSLPTRSTTPPVGPAPSIQQTTTAAAPRSPQTLLPHSTFSIYTYLLSSAPQPHDYPGSDARRPTSVTKPPARG